MPLENEQKTWVELLKKNNADLFDLGYIFGEHFYKYATQNSDDGLITITEGYAYGGLDKIYSKIKLKKFGSDPNPTTYNINNGAITFQVDDKFYANEVSAEIDIAYLWKFNDQPINMVNKVSNNAWKKEINLPTKGANCTPESLSDKTTTINKIEISTEIMNKLGGLVKVPCYYINAKKNGNSIDGIQLTAFSYKANRKPIENSADYSGQYFVEGWMANNNKDQKMDKSRFWSLYPEIYPEVVWNELENTNEPRSNAQWSINKEETKLTGYNKTFDLEENDLVVIYRRKTAKPYCENEISNSQIWHYYKDLNENNSKILRSIGAQNTVKLSYKVEFDPIECFLIPKAGEDSNFENYIKFHCTDSNEDVIQNTIRLPESRIQLDENAFLKAIMLENNIQETVRFATNAQYSATINNAKCCFQIGNWDGVVNPSFISNCLVNANYHGKIPYIAYDRKNFSIFTDYVVIGKSEISSIGSDLVYDSKWQASLYGNFNTSPGTLRGKIPFYNDASLEIANSYNWRYGTEKLTHSFDSENCLYTSQISAIGFDHSEHYLFNMNTYIENQGDQYAYAVVIWRNGKLAYTSA